MIREPGLHFKIPLVQTAIIFDKRLLDYEAPSEEVILGDQRRLIVDSFTRFRITDPPMAERVFDGDGVSLVEHWSHGGMQALHGVTVAGFPNYFHLVGPNTGLGHNSIVYMIETQVDYVIGALDALDREGLAAVHPRRQVQDDYNARLQRELGHTVWNAGGCSRHSGPSCT